MECLDDIHDLVTTAGWKGDARSNGFHVGINFHQPNNLERFSPFEKHADSNISLGFHIDTTSKTSVSS